MRQLPSNLERSFLYVPGNNPKMLDKSLSLEADALIFDLEDSVPVSEKNHARELVAKTFGKVDPKSRLKLGVRINGLDSPYWLTDLAAVMKTGPDFIVLPKTHTALDIGFLQKCTGFYERSEGLDKNTTIISLIEDGLGIANLFSIASAGGRLAGLIFVRADYRADVGCDEGALELPRAMVPIACAAFGLVAIDSAFLEIHNSDRMIEDTVKGKSLGYGAKTAIHPAQLPVISEIYAESKEEVEWARHVVRAHRDSTRRGSGVTVVQGSMVDEAVLKRALKILQNRSSRNKTEPRGLEA